jgi:hypothetical protein
MEKHSQVDELCIDQLMLKVVKAGITIRGALAPNMWREKDPQLQVQSFQGYDHATKRSKAALLLSQENYTVGKLGLSHTSRDWSIANA